MDDGKLLQDLKLTAQAAKQRPSRYTSNLADTTA